jgi:hypothetical protein
MKLQGRKFLIFAIILAICILLPSCSNPLGEREYLDDLYIDVPNTDYQLLIKEWRYLLGSGSEVYLVESSDAKPVHLGNISGGDDGYCPFENGKYTIAYNEGVVTLSWSFDGSDNYTKSESFALDVD